MANVSLAHLLIIFQLIQYWFPISDIQICNVKPLSDNDSVFSKGMFPVPEKISNFYQVNMIKRFQSDRPVHKGPVHKENEFKVDIFFNKRRNVLKKYFYRVCGLNGQRLRPAMRCLEF
jgi:hypothetical protein